MGDLHVAEQRSRKKINSHFEPEYLFLVSFIALTIPSSLVESEIYLPGKIAAMASLNSRDSIVIVGSVASSGHVLGKQIYHQGLTL